MPPDVVDLIEFYQSSLGQVARRLIRRRVREMWPDVRGQVVCGIGYAIPFLRPFRDEAERTFAVMPASQGCVFWPREGPGGVTLADEAELPLPDNSVDRVLLVHGLEFTENLRPMMREIWRVLAGGGRLLTVVPNRRSLWAQVELTPFGHGTPYASSQLKRLLKDNLFQPERTSFALYVPPSRSRFMLRSAGAWEELGGRWFQRFAGVCMIEAAKQIYAPTPRRAEVKRARLMAPVPGAIGRHAAQKPSDALGRTTAPKPESP